MSDQLIKSLEILNEISSDNSRLFKESILKREFNNPLLKRIFEYALNPNFNFWIKQIPHYEKIDEVLSLDEGLNQLHPIMNRDVTGNAAIAQLTLILNKLSSDDAIVLERIIKRDLRCGVSEATVNKIWKGLIPEFKVMLADNRISNIKFPAICQTKMDGIRCHITRTGDAITAFSRAGKLIETLGALDHVAQAMMLDGETWDGELVCFDNDKIMNRQKSNGILNKAISGTISIEEASTITFTAWDIISDRDYGSRFRELQERFNISQNKFRLVHSIIVDDIESAQLEFTKALENGEEGIILKNLNGKWEGKRSKNLCKMKAENTADLRVVRWEEGTGRNAGRLGNLICQTEDGILEVSVGSGFSDDDRNNLTAENTINRILEVQYNQIIKSKTDKKPSLYLPRAIRFRDAEKSKANEFGELT